MAVLAPPVQVVTANAPPFVHVASGAPPFVAVSGNAPPIMIVASGAPPITLFNDDGSLWSAHTPAGGEVLLTGETDGFAADFTHPVDAERVAVKTAGAVVSSGLSFFTSAGTSSKWVFNVAGTLVNIPVGTLPLDYDPVTHAARGLLCEPAATNIMVGSSDLSIMTAEQGAATLNNQTGPDGALTADTFTENTATGTHNCYGSVTTTLNADYAYSFYLKMGTRRYATLGLSDGTKGAYAVYDLQSGVVGSSAAIATGTLNSASIQAVGNGWYRCTLSAKAPAASTVYSIGTANAATITPDAYGRQSFLGTSATLFVVHRQLETGTIATSPIPTTVASVTRAVDQYNVTPASINYSATAGSWWAEMYLMGGATDEWIIGTNSAATPLFYNIGGVVIRDGTQVYIPPGPAITNQINKLMSAFTTGSRAVTYNGQAPAADAGTVTNILATTYIGFGCNLSPGNAVMRGYIRKVRYLPRRPSNAEMQTMTT